MRQDGDIDPRLVHRRDPRVGEVAQTPLLVVTGRVVHREIARGRVLIISETSLALAQTTSPTLTTTASKASGSLQISHNTWRAAKLNGATIYNEQGTSIGTMDDMLVTSSGNVSNGILSVGGFLGMGSKYVDVPFSKLKFEPSKGSAPTTGDTTAASDDNSDYSVVLPGATYDSLKDMTAFNY